MKSLFSIAILAASVPSLLPSCATTTEAAEDMSPVVVLTTSPA